MTVVSRASSKVMAGKDIGEETPRQHRLTGARRADEQQVVALRRPRPPAPAWRALARAHVSKVDLGGIAGGSRRVEGGGGKVLPFAAGQALTWPTSESDLGGCTTRPPRRCLWGGRDRGRAPRRTAGMAPATASQLPGRRRLSEETPLQQLWVEMAEARQHAEQMEGRRPRLPFEGSRGQLLVTRASEVGRSRNCEWPGPAPWPTSNCFADANDVEVRHRPRGRPRPRPPDIDPGWLQCERWPAAADLQNASVPRPSALNS